jgi:hypothetical protein
LALFDRPHLAVSRPSTTDRAEPWQKVGDYHPHESQRTEGNYQNGLADLLFWTLASYGLCRPRAEMGKRGVTAECEAVVAQPPASRRLQIDRARAATRPDGDEPLRGAAGVR